MWCLLIFCHKRWDFVDLTHSFTSRQSQSRLSSVGNLLPIWSVRLVSIVSGPTPGWEGADIVAMETGSLSFWINMWFVLQYEFLQAVARKFHVKKKKKNSAKPHDLVDLVLSALRFSSCRIDRLSACQRWWTCMCMHMSELLQHCVLAVFVFTNKHYVAWACGGWQHILFFLLMALCTFIFLDSLFGFDKARALF